MKHEWRKHEKEIYGAKAIPRVVDIPPQKYITLSGTGNPNSDIFSDKVSALFSATYKIKMAYKAFAAKNNLPVNDYSVYPLEGIWGKAFEKEELVKEELQYDIMIRQPDFITREMFDAALETAKKKSPNIYLSDISFETIQDGVCLQLLHKGSYDEEPASFAVMDRFCLEHSYERIGKTHREIYLNNAGRTEKSRLKTILRYRLACYNENA